MIESPLRSSARIRSLLMPEPAQETGSGAGLEQRAPALDWHRPTRARHAASPEPTVFSTPVQSRWAPPLPGERHSTDGAFAPAPLQTASASSADDAAGRPTPGADRSAALRSWARGLRAMRIVAKVLAGCALTLMLAVAAFVIALPASIGGTPVTVSDDAMAPALHRGDLAVVRPVPAASIGVGDVVVVDAAHPRAVRVTAVHQTALGGPELTIASDAGTRAVRTIDADSVVGGVCYSMPILGRANDWLNGPARGWLVPVIALSLFAYAAGSIVSGARSVREGRRRSAILRAMSTTR